MTTADPAPVAEATRFYRDLPDVANVPVAVIFNRTLPTDWIGAKPPPKTKRDLAENLKKWGAESLRQVDTRTEFAALNSALVVTIPWVAHPPTSLDLLENLLKNSDALPRDLLGISRGAVN